MSQQDYPEQPADADFTNGLQGKRVSLVLGSGGARGLAHIGVIQELERRGCIVEAIAGCSIGALVGGIHAVGKLEEFTKWVSRLERTQVWGLMDITGARGGMIGGKKIMERLHEWIGDVQIEDLPIKYTAVAVDIEREKEIWMSEGPLWDAIRASISIPGIFTPHRYRDRVLVDGGVLTPLPVAPTVSALTDMTIVVDANGPPSDFSPLDEPQDDMEEVGGLLGGRLDFFSRGDGKKELPSKPALTIVEVMLRSLDTMQAAMTRQHLAVFHPDLVIRVPRNLCMIHEFHLASEVIELGRSTACELLDDPELERRQWL